METMVHLTADRFPLIRDIGWNQTESLYCHPDRILDYDVFLYVVKGSMQVIEEGTHYLVGENQFLFLKNQLHHWGSAKTPAGTTWYWIHFNTVVDNRIHYKENIPLPELDYYYPDYYEYEIILPKYGTSIPGTEARIISMMESLRERQRHKMTRTSIEVYQLFLEQQLASSETGIDAAAANRITERIMSYLVAHIEEPFNSSNLALHMNMNYSYISSSFKKTTGQTIIDAHTRLKLNKAVELMRQSSLNIAEISEQLGYHNPFYFTRVFKKVFGQPPSSYMREFYKP